MLSKRHQEAVKGFETSEESNQAIARGFEVFEMLERT
jgi:hypothetical protein